MSPAGDKCHLPAFLKHDFTVLRLSPGSWAGALSHYPRNLPWPGAAKMQQELLFPTFLKQFQVQSAGIIQLQPISLLHTGQRGAAENTGMHVSSPGALHLLTGAHLAGCAEGSGSRTQPFLQWGHCSLEQAVYCTLRAPTLWVKGKPTRAPHQLCSAFPDPDWQTSGLKNHAPLKSKQGCPYLYLYLLLQII